jgi:hypothetical protein
VRPRASENRKHYANAVRCETLKALHNGRLVLLLERFGPAECHLPRKANHLLAERLPDLFTASRRRAPGEASGAGVDSPLRWMN